MNREPEHPDVYRARTRRTECAVKVTLLSLAALATIAAFTTGIWAALTYGGGDAVSGVVIIGGAVVGVLAFPIVFGLIEQVHGLINAHSRVGRLRNEYAWKQQQAEQEQMRRLLREHGINPEGTI